ncbi:hypothetical protein KEM09_11820 [Carboxylicivirga mesophila]|uniref:Polymerase/histidinol phosphatase N-terminal domain-containing protein n=1 Tax=Carboxylicivirga mesophila TaxID=1166478 RepID=A0ABS5KAX2_9BACT|nr:Sb-PDE family phosphodiesterase [Carboxylicivirga mesophila]MBS2212096.1 hypothetical protein [Carboxylicivirga mesophila]
MINKQTLLTSLLLLLYVAAFAQFDLNHQSNNLFIKPNVRQQILIPDITGYHTLKGDFHIHTIFSDGSVWPTVRVEEAWREGLDVIAITDHLEYQPHKDYTVADNNTAYKLAQRKAEEMNVILVKGTEITKGEVPPGHFNAIFIDDANPIENKDASLSIEAAVKQGAFIIWNHPGWKRQQPDTTKWWDYYTTLKSKNMLHGIEVANSNEWYPIAIDWCIDKDLTVFSNSDIHAPVNLKYNLSERHAHRPITLIFAREKSMQSVKEALFEGRTIAWHGHTLAGKESIMRELVKASIQLKPTFRETQKKGTTWYYAELNNISDIPFVLRDKDGNEIDLKPLSSVIVKFDKKTAALNYKVMNAFIGSERRLEINITPQ